MRKLTLLSLLFISFSAYSQNDSTRLDAGGIVLKRAFTQSVSIKGEDLEKMPFANLAEAINVWLNGSYTNPSYMTYVVDGNIISDVNSYSIHDIEEIVLVQNASVLTGLGTGQQQMLLITTRKGKGRSGIQGAAQTFLVSAPKASGHLYHQYYLHAYRNLDKVSFGISANYLRDAEPSLTDQHSLAVVPYHLDRWRLNGYFAWRPDQKNVIEVHAGFAPQFINAATSYENNYSGTSFVKTDYNGHERTNLFLPWARWHGEWVPGLRNDLQVGYATEHGKGKSWSLSVDSDPTVNRYYNEMNASDHADHIYVRDRLSYEIKGGGWSFEPAINASYEHVKSAAAQNSISESGPNVGPGQVDLGNISTSGQGSGVGGKLWLLTPTMDLSFKQGFDIQGGFSANVTHVQGNTQGLKRVFPFASVTLDLLRLGGSGKRGSLQLLGSYAQRDLFTYNDYTLGDLSGGNNVFNYQPPPVFGSGGISVLPATNNIKNFWVWQTGARWTSRDSRWQLSYNFQRSNFATLGLNTGPFGGVYVYSEWKSSQHFAGISLRVVDKGGIRWQTGLTATTIRNKAGLYATTYYYKPLGNYGQGNDRPSWTGGWTNRVQIRDLSFGVDMLYHFNREVEMIIPSGATTYSYANMFLIQNVYIGYKLHLPGKTGLEIYADSRGLVRSDKSDVLDQRRYYGVGGKITI